VVKVIFWGGRYSYLIGLEIISIVAAVGRPQRL